MREGLLSKLKPKDRDIVERIRTAVKGQRVEDSLRKLARDN
jgi:hypothetical protein